MNFFVCFLVFTSQKNLRIAKAAAVPSNHHHHPARSFFRSFAQIARHQRATFFSIFFFYRKTTAAICFAFLCSLAFRRRHCCRLVFTTAFHHDSLDCRGHTASLPSFVVQTLATRLSTRVLKAKTNKLGAHNKKRGLCKICKFIRNSALASLVDRCRHSARHRAAAARRGARRRGCSLSKQFLQRRKDRESRASQQNKQPAS